MIIAFQQFIVWATIFKDYLNIKTAVIWTLMAMIPFNPFLYFKYYKIKKSIKENK